MARGADAEPLGRAVAALRGDVVQLLALEVSREARGRGLGRALYDAVRAYARGRGAKALEARADDASGLGFLLRRGLGLRTPLLVLEGALPAPPSRFTLSPQRLAPGPAFTGWVADLDRETRGFARTPEWNRWAREAEVWSLRSRGRPEAVAALRLEGETALAGPIAGRRPEQAAEAIPFLVGRGTVLGARRVRLVLPAEARAPLAAAFACGLRVAGSAFLLGSRARGDFRRYAASSGPYA